MRTKSLSLKFFQPAVLSVLAIITLWGVSIRPAQAYLLRLGENGSDVVLKGSGSINLTGLTFDFTHKFDNGGLVFIHPVSGTIIAGQMGIIWQGDFYSGFTGPTSFGSGTGAGPNFSGGRSLGFEPDLRFPEIIVPHLYRGGSLDTHMTFTNSTFDSLGVTPGTYVWTWGTGLPNQNVTLIVGGHVQLPDGGSTFGLLLVSLVALFGVGRFCAQRLA